MTQRPRTPTRMLQAATPRSGPRPPDPTRWRHDPGAEDLSTRPASPSRGVVAEPSMHGLACQTPAPSGDLGDRDPLVQHPSTAAYRCSTTFSSTSTTTPPGPTTSNQKHSPSASRVEHTPVRSHCRPRTGPASPKCHPATGATWKASTGTAHDFVPESQDCARPRTPSAALKRASDQALRGEDDGIRTPRWASAPRRRSGRHRAAFVTRHRPPAAGNRCASRTGCGGRRTCRRPPRRSGGPRSGDRRRAQCPSRAGSG